MNISGDADSGLRILQILQSSLTFLGGVDHNLKCLIIVSISIPSTNILQYSMRMGKSSHSLLLLEVFCIAAVVLVESAILLIHKQFVFLTTKMQIFILHFHLFQN